MESTDQVKADFCEHCGKQKDDCIEVDGKKFCCHDCHQRGPLDPKPNTCEFC